MLVGIITFHRATNYGAILQALALQNFLKSNGINNEIIDYRSKFLEYHNRPFHWKKVIHLRSFLLSVINNSIVIANSRGFSSFRRKYMITSKPVVQKQLNEIEKKYTYIITGSDQVWNLFCSNFDRAYFLDFVKDKTKKIAYAASIGLSSIPPEYINEYYDLLKDYNYISVREKQGSKILHELLGLDIRVLVDPTLLLTMNEWSEYARELPLANSEYILIYLITETPSIINFAKKLSEATKMEIKYINDRIIPKRGLQNIKFIDPQEWLGLFLKASYIITNSYHGTIFSINFNKNFFTEMLPEPAKVNSRLSDILDLLGLKQRVIVDGKNDYIYEPINYSIVNNIIEKERKKATSFIELLKEKNNHE